MPGSRSQKVTEQMGEFLPFPTTKKKTCPVSLSHWGYQQLEDVFCIPLRSYYKARFLTTVIATCTWPPGNLLLGLTSRPAMSRSRWKVILQVAQGKVMTAGLQLCRHSSGHNIARGWNYDETLKWYSEKDIFRPTSHFSVWKSGIKCLKKLQTGCVKQSDIRFFLKNTQGVFRNVMLYWVETPKWAYTPSHWVSWRGCYFIGSLFPKKACPSSLGNILR